MWPDKNIGVNTLLDLKFHLWKPKGVASNKSDPTAVMIHCVYKWLELKKFRLWMLNKELGGCRMVHSLPVDWRITTMQVKCTLIMMKHHWIDGNYCSMIYSWPVLMLGSIYLLSFSLFYVGQTHRQCCFSSIFIYYCFFSNVISDLDSITDLQHYNHRSCLCFCVPHSKTQLIHFAYCYQLRIFISCISESISRTASLSLRHRCYEITSALKH